MGWSAEGGGESVLEESVGALLEGFELDLLGASCVDGESFVAFAGFSSSTGELALAFVDFFFRFGVPGEDVGSRCSSSF